MVNSALATNKCSWLYLGSTRRCGKNSYGEFCGVHNCSAKQGCSNGQRPCIGCGKGVRGKYQICIACGSLQYRSAIEYLRRKNRPIPAPEEFLATLREKQVNEKKVNELKSQ